MQLKQIGEDLVRVSGAKGRGVPENYKVSLTWADGWRAGTTVWYLGRAAAEKGRLFAQQVVDRTRQKLNAVGLSDFDAIEVEIVGDESHWGDARKYTRSREVAVKIACRHQDKKAVATLLREVSGAALGAPPGLAMFAGTRAKPSPVIRLFSTLVPKSTLEICVECGDARRAFALDLGHSPETLPAAVHTPALVDDVDTDLVEVPLERLAWARSGDKGNKANIGVMARKAAFLPWIARTLTTEFVTSRFAHFMDDHEADRYYLPGLQALNFVLHNR